MTAPKLHVIIGDSAGGSVRKALELAGSPDEIAIFIDGLSFGPVDYPDLQARKVWMERELGMTGFDRIIAHSGPFWDRVLSGTRQPVLWFSGRSAMEYSGFLECLWRLGDSPCSVLDVTDMDIRTRPKLNPERTYKAIYVGLLSHDAILENDLLNKAMPITKEQRQHYHVLWSQLRAENAPFRVVSENGLASAPITYFDELIRLCITKEWQKSARVIGEALGKEYLSGYAQTGDLVLFSRLCTLVELGLVEGREDLSEWHQSEVRLATTE
jgi:hypothetical protein